MVTNPWNRSLIGRLFRGLFIPYEDLSNYREMKELNSKRMLTVINGKYTPALGTGKSAKGDGSVWHHS